MAQKLINQSKGVDFLQRINANENLRRISLPFYPNGYSYRLKKASQRLHLKKCKWLYGIAVITQVFI